MLKKLLTLILLFNFLNGFSLDVTPQGAPQGIIKGYVFDKNNNQALEYATISIVSLRNNKVVNGTITDETGFFKIKNISFGSYKVKLTFIGYETKVIEKVILKPNDREIDLGKLYLNLASKNIDAVVINADRPTMSYKIDKKVINVSQQHTSASGTAVEILENIPSVTVDIEGNVSLRGSESFTVLIDNKPTVLEPSDVLNQIPASTIENIEVITNPSSKYDPDGTSGIINIITKKNKLQGINGIVNLNAGMYGRHGGDFLFNWRKERFNVFFGADYNNRSMKGGFETKDWRIINWTPNRNETNDTIVHNLSEGDFERTKNSYSIRTGFDLTINPRNSIAFETQLGYREYQRINIKNRETFTNQSTNRILAINDENSQRGGSYYSFNLNYTRKFLRKGHELYALLNCRVREVDEESTNVLTNMNNSIVSGQQSFEKGPFDSYRIQLDYTLPLFEKSKFEAGYNSRIFISDDKTDLKQYNLSNQVYEIVPLFSHNVEYSNNIHAVYAMYSGEINRWGYKAGLRGEYTDRDIQLKETTESSLIERFDFFPTLHMSYSTKKENQWMANYSRRIHRPRGWNLEPFITWVNANSVRQGNPDLLPEYIDSYELSHLIKFGRNSLSLDGYYRITNNKIERLWSTYETQEVSAADNVKKMFFDNVGKDYSLGVEVMLGLNLFPWWHVDLMGNVYDYRVEGELEYKVGNNLQLVDFSESSFTWNTRLNNTLRLGKKTRVQFNAMYNSPRASAQGEREGFLLTTLAVRQNIYKNKLAATLQVRDVFGTMHHASESSGLDFYSYYNFHPNTPVVSFTLSFRLNNYKPDRKKRTNGNGEGLEDDGEF